MMNYCRYFLIILCMKYGKRLCIVRNDKFAKQYRVRWDAYRISAWGKGLRENQVFAIIDECLQFGVWFRHSEVMFQQGPASGVLGFEEGDIDENGVVDAEVLDEGGVDAIRIFVMCVKVADLVGGEDVSPLKYAEENEGLDKSQQGYNSPEFFLVELLFHICMIVWLTES